MQALPSNRIKTAGVLRRPISCPSSWMEQDAHRIREVLLKAESSVWSFSSVGILTSEIEMLPGQSDAAMP